MRYTDGPVAGQEQLRIDPAAESAADIAAVAPAAVPLADRSTGPKLESPRTKFRDPDKVILPPVADEDDDAPPEPKPEPAKTKKARKSRKKDEGTAGPLPGQPAPPSGPEPAADPDAAAAHWASLGVEPPLDAAASPDDPSRHRVVITHMATELRESIDAAEAALAGEPSLFARGQLLVRLIPAAAVRSGEYAPSRPPDAPVIAPVADITLAELLTDRAIFFSPSPKKKDDVVPVRPPVDVVSGLQARGRWPHLRDLRGVVEAPTIRPDGSLLDVPGWDEATGYLFVRNAEYLPVPASPTLDDAKAAVAILFALVQDFPFAGPADRAAWLALVLTRVARAAIDGPVPATLIDANVPGAGKTNLGRLVEAIAAGRLAADRPYPRSDAEMSKVLLSIALAGDQYVVFDNIEGGGTFGCPSLSLALTSTMYSGRILQTNTAPALPWSTVIVATGNNVTLGDDLPRRTNVCRLVAASERPEERSGFALQPDCPCGCGGEIVSHARLARPSLLRSALTILRAHAVAGRPTVPGLCPVDYVAWSSVIRHAVAWATGHDPCATRAEARESSQDLADLVAIQHALAAVCACRNVADLSAAEMIELAQRPAAGVLPEPYAALRAILLRWSKTADLPCVQVVGNKLGGFRGRRSPSGTLDRRKLHGTFRWSVKAAEGGAA